MKQPLTYTLPTANTSEILQFKKKKKKKDTCCRKFEKKGKSCCKSCPLNWA